MSGATVQIFEVDRGHALKREPSTFTLDPYAQVETMRRSGQWPQDFSCEDGPQGAATSAHSLGCHEHPRCVVPASVDFGCATRTEIVEQLHVNPEQSGIAANDGVVASCSRLSSLPLESCSVESGNWPQRSPTASQDLLGSKTMSRSD
jgi:hypothetical protein